MDENKTTNPDIAERIAKDKQSLIDALKEMPIVITACKKAGVSHATYYRWRKEDQRFRQMAEDAAFQGVELVNDITEAQLISLVKEKKMPAISLWLKNHHERYGAKVGPSVPDVRDDELTEKEKTIAAEALALASGRPAKKQTRLHGNNS